MADGIAGAVADVVKDFAEEGKTQVKQLVGGIPQQVGAQLSGSDPHADPMKAQQGEIKRQQKIANLRQYLSQETQKTQAKNQARAQEGIVGPKPFSQNPLQQGSGKFNIGLQTKIAATHQETKGNKSGE